MCNPRSVESQRGKAPRKQNPQIAALVGDHFFCTNKRSTMATINRLYLRTLRTFLSHLDAIEYTQETEITQERLVQLTPADIVRYFNFRAYGTERPTEGDRPMETSSNPPYYWQKALSGCLPNRHIPWNDISKLGNPTKSIQVHTTHTHAHTHTHTNFFVCSVLFFVSRILIEL